MEYFTRLGERVGIDPILPILGMVENRPKIINVAVFQKDRFVGEISLKEAFLVNQMRETPIDAMIPLENYRENIAYEGDVVANEDSIYVSLSLSSGRGKIKMVDEDKLAFNAQINMRVQLLDTSIPMDIKSETTTRRIEQDLEDYFKGEYEQLFIKLQEMKSDALDLGRVYASTRKGKGAEQLKMNG